MRAQQIGHQKTTDADQDKYHAQKLADRLCHLLRLLQMRIKEHTLSLSSGNVVAK